MRKKLLFSILLLFLVSCKDKHKIASISQVTSNYKSLTSRVKKTGDINAYDELYYGFKDSNNTESVDSILVYARLMAMKFHYKNAYTHYFDAICEKNGIDPYNGFDKVDLTKLDDGSKNEAIYCLKKMIESKLINKEDFNKIVNKS